MTFKIANGLQEKSSARRTGPNWHPFIPITDVLLVSCRKVTDRHLEQVTDRHLERKAGTAGNRPRCRKTRKGPARSAALRKLTAIRTIQGGHRCSMIREKLRCCSSNARTACWENTA